MKDAISGEVGERPCGLVQSISEPSSTLSKPDDCGNFRICTLDLDELVLANQTEGQGYDHLNVMLETAFGHDGLGIACVVGGDEFQAQVREIRETLLPLAPELDKLPEAAKNAIRERGTLNVNNYSRGLDGNRSGIYFHPTTDTPGCLLPECVDADPTFYTPNLWPDGELPKLRQRARIAAPFVVNVGRELVSALDRYCAHALPGYASGTLQRLVARPETCNHKCRLICYHEYENAAQRLQSKSMWAAPHKDTCLLTALVPGVFLDASTGDRLATCPDPEVGLYVRNRQGVITQIKVPTGVGECLLFQAGEALQIVTGGLLHATEHCVRGPPRALAGYVRASLAVFFQPHAHEDLVLPEGVSLQEVAARCSDAMLRMFLHYQPREARAINFLHFCLREGF
eukprot:TRINITY_DN5495_c0_g2_i1.p1 TRINITY_DN5495_c0_g2~~TRINITY_DN5495_c0_g2_i1.p1  ORF type:complete len:416 (-),score=43.10 TRINITY_DN5495_c0_g2_i1:248-1447(-)